MATHDAGIVDQMQRRVVELVSGQVVRDERQGGYLTQSIPVQDDGYDGSAHNGLNGQYAPSPRKTAPPTAAPAPFGGDW